MQAHHCLLTNKEKAENIEIKRNIFKKKFIPGSKICTIFLCNDTYN